MKNLISDNLKNNRVMIDIVVIGAIATVLILIISSSGYFLKYFSQSLAKDSHGVAEWLIILIIISISLIVFSVRRWFELRDEVFRRKDMERRMFKSRAELQAVLDGVPDMIMQVDTNLKILWANKAVLNRDAQALGKTCKEAFSIIGESVIETYSKWAMVTGIIEKGIKYQPTMIDDDTGSYWEGIGIPLKAKDGTIYGAIAIGRDVTERMRIEHTSNLLASIMESTDDAIYGMTFDTTVLSWNLGAENIYGYYPGEIIGTKANKTIPPEDRDFFLGKIEKVIRSQEIERFEYKRNRKDQKQIFVSVTLCPFVDATGRKIGVSAIDRDITQRKKAEQALIESESRYRELFANMSSGVAVYEAINNGKDFIFKDMNHGAEKIENMERGQLINKKCSYIFERANIPEAMDIIRNVYKTGKSAQHLLTIKNNNRVQSWRDNRLYKLPSGEIVAIYDDITERVVAEEALKGSEEKFRTLVSTAPDGIVLIDIGGTIIEVNLAFADIFEFERNEILGKNFTDFFPEGMTKEKALEILGIESNNNKMMSKRKSTEDFNLLQREIKTKSKSGREIYIELSIAHLQDELGNLTGMIAITRDVSIRKQYEYELKDSREQMRNLAIHLQSAREEERKNIAFEIHDELGYALTALKLDLAWLMKKTNTSDNTIISKSKTMAELIDTTINKVRTISTQLRPSILDHFGLIAAIEWQANEFQKRTAIRCKVVLEPTDMQFKDPFSTAIFRIFQETLTNIARHAKASRVDVSLQRKGEGKKENGEENDESYLELRVSDNGVGLSKDELINPKSLGLIGIRERAKSLGGNVEFISDNRLTNESGSGTTVLLTIPIKEIIKE
ncbi:MAG: PAS domain S-box protein [bacterium]